MNRDRIVNTPRGRSLGAPGQRNSTPTSARARWSSQGAPGTPVGTPRRTSRTGTLRSAARPQVYMPRQGLFEGENVFDALDGEECPSDEEMDDGGIPFYQSQSFAESSRSRDISGTASPMQTFNTPSTAQPKEPPVNFVALFQEQQATFQTISKQQENLQKQYEHLIEKQKTSEEKISWLEETLQSELAGGTGKQKAKVTRQLTVCSSLSRATKLAIHFLEFSGFCT